MGELTAGTTFCMASHWAQFDLDVMHLLSLMQAHVYNYAREYSCEPEWRIGRSDTSWCEADDSADEEDHTSSLVEDDSC